MDYISAGLCLIRCLVFVKKKWSFIINKTLFFTVNYHVIVKFPSEFATKFWSYSFYTLKICFIGITDNQSIIYPHVVHATGERTPKRKMDHHTYLTENPNHLSILLWNGYTMLCKITIDQHQSQANNFNNDIL